MKYRFRLRLASKQEGKFEFPTPEREVQLSPDLTLSIVARNADTLERATSFHIDAGGFTSQSAARHAAEALKVRLRLINAILGLGLNIPAKDAPSVQVSDEIKRKVKKEHDAIAIDGVWGISTFPDDGRHFEYVMSGNLLVRSSDSSHLITALRMLWPLEIHLDQISETALHILGLGTLEASDKAAFLTSYLALEQLIKREPRSFASQALIRRFQAHVERATRRKSSPLLREEAESMSGALAALAEESFSSALTRFVGRITAPTHVRGVPLRRFISSCISARNRIAHNAELDVSLELARLTTGLREFILMIIWTRNHLPPFSIQTPPSAVSIPAGGLKMRVL